MVWKCTGSISCVFVDVNKKKFLWHIWNYFTWSLLWFVYFRFFNASYIHTQMCLLFNFISKYMLTVVAYLVAISCAEFRQCSGAVLEARQCFSPSMRAKCTGTTLNSPCRICLIRECRLLLLALATWWRWSSAGRVIPINCLLCHLWFPTQLVGNPGDPL